MSNEGKQILVVEDDMEVCNSILTALSKHGYRPVGVTSAREAMFKLKNQAYSCILLDIKLGDEDGVELLSFIRERKDSENKHTPVLVVSGHLDKNLLVKIASQIQGAMVKPFEQSDLIAQVEKLVGSQLPKA